MSNHLSPHRWVSPALVALALSGALTSRAEVATGESHGFGLQLGVGAGAGAELELIGLNATGLLGATVNTGQLPSGANGVAPGIYNVSDSTLQVFASGNLASVAGLSLGPIAGTTASATAGLVGTSGTFNGQADSNVDGGLGARLAHGHGSIEELRLDFADLSIMADTLLIDPLTLNSPPLLSFTQAENTTLSSDSTVSGDANALTRLGTSIIADLGISVNGQSAVSLSSLLTAASISYSLDGQGNISVAPNTSLTLGVGASLGGAWSGLGSGLLSGVSVGTDTELVLTLNKQVETGDGLASAGITTTALEIKLNDLDMGLTLAGLATLDVSGGSDLTVLLGQSHAELTAVPEPGTYAGGLVVLGLLGYTWRRRLAAHPAKS